MAKESTRGGDKEEGPRVVHTVVRVVGEANALQHAESPGDVGEVRRDLEEVAVPGARSEAGIVAQRQGLARFGAKRAPPSASTTTQKNGRTPVEETSTGPPQRPSGSVPCQCARCRGSRSLPVGELRERGDHGVDVKFSNPTAASEACVDVGEDLHHFALDHFLLHALGHEAKSHQVSWNLSWRRHGRGMGAGKNHTGGTRSGNGSVKNGAFGDGQARHEKDGGGDDGASETARTAVAVGTRSPGAHEPLIKAPTRRKGHVDTTNHHQPWLELSSSWF